MPTAALPGTSCLCEGLWPWTSAEGLSTRKYSAGRWKVEPSSKSISSTRSARFRRISSGQCCVSKPLPLIGALLRRGRARLRGGALVLAEAARLLDQHDRDAVANGVGE